jgi:hypothetical protein
MIPRHPFACAGRDQGIQLYNQLMIEWQENLLAGPIGNPPMEKAAESESDDNFIQDALSIFSSSKDK